MVWYGLLQRDHVCGRQSLRAIFDIEADALSLVQGLESIPLYSAEVDKNIISTVAVFNKAKPFLLVKPLHCTFCHFLYPLSSRFLEYPMGICR